MSADEGDMGLRAALESRDLLKIGVAVDRLRGAGLNYLAVFGVASRVDPTMDIHRWDELMEDVDEAESAS